LAPFTFSSKIFHVGYGSVFREVESDDVFGMGREGGRERERFFWDWWW
jgi:hypothetical protein